MEKNTAVVITTRWVTMMTAVKRAALTATTEDVTTGECDFFYLYHSLDLKLVLMQLNSSEFTSTAI